jgi:pimeloyl-ACP methyl ester carboxylesterase
MVRITYLIRTMFIGMTFVWVVLSGGVSAQELKDVVAPKEPMVIKEHGSFFVGGRTSHVDLNGLDAEGPAYVKQFGLSGDSTVDQMYVQFQKPMTGEKRLAIVFIPGCCLSSKEWETTPDGRMGWYDYFTHKGYPTYLAEQAGRARSGFNTAGFNEVQASRLAPSEQRRIIIVTHQVAWVAFRLGPKYGIAWPDEQFPVEKINEFYKQLIPDLILTEVPDAAKEHASPTTKNPTIDDLARLSEELGGAILVGHSQSSWFPTQVALKERPGVRGLVQLETGCFSNLTEHQIAVLAKVPVLVVVGDHFAVPQPSADCTKEMQQVNAAGGDFTFIALPDKGIRGNSHMFMQDKNNLEVADVIVDWIKNHVENRAQ